MLLLKGHTAKEIMGEEDYELSLIHICKRFNDYYGLTKEGNFQGRNIPNRLHLHGAGDMDEWNALDDVLPAIRQYRKMRETLHLDDKILTAWNGLMITALAFLYRVTGEEEYLLTAQRARGFIEEHLTERCV